MIFLVGTIKKLVSTPKRAFMNKGMVSEDFCITTCSICHKKFKYKDRFYELAYKNIAVHVTCLHKLCEEKKIYLEYVGEREELYIESPCNELIDSMYGRITYLEFLVLESRRLRLEGRFPKIEIRRQGFTCLLLIEPYERPNWER